jgi:hypothetical protein
MNLKFSEFDCTIIKCSQFHSNIIEFSQLNLNFHPNLFPFKINLKKNLRGRGPMAGSGGRGRRLGGGISTGALAQPWSRVVAGGSIGPEVARYGG